MSHSTIVWHHNFAMSFVFWDDQWKFVKQIFCINALNIFIFVLKNDYKHSTFLKTKIADTITYSWLAKLELEIEISD